MFTSTGGMGWEATTFYKHLADLIATHWGQPYRITIHWLRCCMFFALPSYVFKGAGSGTTRLVSGLC